MTPDDQDNSLDDGHEQLDSPYPDLPEGAPKELKRTYSIGKTLCIILDEAIEFERLKKRRRMTPDLQRRPMLPLRLYQDVHAVIEHIKAAQPAPRPAAQLKRLKRLQKSLSLQTLDVSSIEPWIWMQLGAFEPEDQENLINNPKLLALRLDEAILEAQSSPDYAIDKRGGRRPDPRLDSLLHKLAYLYREYTGFRVTYSEATDASGQQSPFFQFAAEVLQIFFVEGEEADWASRDGAIQSAIRRISKFERESGPMSDEESKHILSRSD